jgi:hypothetical protein
VKRSVEKGRKDSILYPDDPRKHIRVLVRYYQKVVEARLPFRCIGRKKGKLCREQILFEGLDCPLSTDGRSVSHIIGMLSVRRPDDFKPGECL